MKGQIIHVDTQEWAYFNFFRKSSQILPFLAIIRPEMSYDFLGRIHKETHRSLLCILLANVDKKNILIGPHTLHRVHGDNILEYTLLPYTQLCVCIFVCMCLCTCGVCMCACVHVCSMCVYSGIVLIVICLSSANTS